LAYKIKGLGVGADDYMTKPFHKDELVARIHAIVRRSKGHAQSVIQTGDLVVNLDTKTVEVGGQRVHLTGKTKPRPNRRGFCFWGLNGRCGCADRQVVRRSRHRDSEGPSCGPNRPGVASDLQPAAECPRGSSTGGGHGWSSRSAFFSGDSSSLSPSGSSDAGSGTVTRGGFGSLARAFTASFSGGG
jgi:hypothetical protein